MKVHGARTTAIGGLLAALCLLLTACVTLPREGFTVAEEAAATPPGFAHVRWAEDDPALAASLQSTARPGPDGIFNAIAISGGGANGAYGAGLISGWTQTGTRPVFQLVTGVSAGALTAPFAFLGKDWDPQLRAAYLDGQLQHLLHNRGPAALLTPGLYSKAPLTELVAGYVTSRMLADIAAEHRKGRRLLVATTDLDTEQLVVWDMGAIAAHGGAAARRLFVQVLVASASVPVVFPPSLITVEAGGHRFREMHVDGQAESAFFGVPQTMLLAPTLRPSGFKTRLYVVINGALDNVFQVTPRGTLPIVSRTADVAVKASLRSLLIANAEYCRVSDCGFYVASLPLTVKDGPLDFSAGHLRTLFAAGQTDIVTGTAWRTPPKS
jgi:hypothetical protein